MGDVDDEVRSDILFGRRPPSARLALNEIAEQRGVSRPTDAASG